MRVRIVGIAALLAAASAQPAAAQRPLSLELGAFGQYSLFEDNLNLENAPTIGGRAALWLWKRFALEGDIAVGKTDWDNNGTTKSVTLRPYGGRLLWAIPAGERNRILLGAGYQNNVYIGRTRTLPSGTVAGNEYEDAFTGLIGLRHCLNQRWNLRGDVVSSHAPSPNFNNSNPTTLDGNATTFGLRFGVGFMARGGCYDAPPPPPPAPLPAPAPPTPLPDPAPTPPANTPPTLRITSPASGAAFTTEISFTATCTDTEDGDISSRVRWSSNRDGDIGTGATTTRRLTSGSHTVTATCVDAGGSSVTQTVNVSANELLVRLNWVYFNFDQSTLTRAGRDTLARVVATLKERADWKVAVEGHTDPYGSDDYNQRLSERRAATVATFLTQGGIDAGRISQKGFGEQCLILDDDRTRPAKSRNEHRANRRVEIWSVGDQGASANCRRP